MDSWWPVGAITALGVAGIVGAQVYRRMQAEVSPVGVETYCGGCGIPIADAAGIVSLVVILLLVGIVLVSRAWMVCRFGTANTDEAEGENVG